MAPFIIAEAGSNHNGSADRAIALVDLAKRAGADSIKFQFIFADGLYLPAYFDGGDYVDNSVYHARKAEELPRWEWERIWAHAESHGIDVSASVFDSRGVELLAHLGASYVKIASTDITNHELIGMACQSFERVILSTGMASLAEIDCAYQFVRQQFPSVTIELMHCVSAYPCPLREANIQRVQLLTQSFNCAIGYSDHTEGAISAAMAMVKGATFFEKHFTVDQALPGFDHATALTEQQLGDYVATLHECTLGLSEDANQSSSSEKITKIRARRGVYAACDLPADHIIRREDLLFVRPSTSYMPKNPSDLVGTILAEPISQYEPLALSATGASRGLSNWKSAQEYWRSEMQAKGMKP
jgi:sialic acid synthase SpsE